MHSLAGMTWLKPWLGQVKFRQTLALQWPVNVTLPYHGHGRAGCRRCALTHASVTTVYMCVPYSSLPNSINHERARGVEVCRHLA